MRTLQDFALPLGLLLLTIGVSAAQQPSSDSAPSPSKATVTTADFVPPQLLPLQRAISSADTCKEEAYGTVSLSLVVDRHGMPGKISVIDRTGSSVEELALRLVEEDSFKPATLNGEALDAKGSISISILACFATTQDGVGTTTEVLRLKGQPVQTLGKFSSVQDPEPQNGAATVSPAVRKPLNGRTPGVTPPVALNHVEAEFSEEARRGGFSGVCLVSVIVNGEGRPLNAKVIRSLGHGLDEKAIEAVNKYRFKPAMKDGSPISVMITVAVNFRFRDF